MSVTHQEVLFRLEYRKGHLWWVNPPAKSRAKVGDRFGGKNPYGYIVGNVCCKRLQEHRLVWFYHHGVWPKIIIDHINGIKDDNRIENLREVNFSQNSQNKKSHKNSSSGYKGVSWCKQTQKWKSCIKVNNTRKTLGRYKTEKEAAIAYDIVANNNFGQYALLNFKENS